MDMDEVQSIKVRSIFVSDHARIPCMFNEKGLCWTTGFASMNGLQLYKLSFYSFYAAGLVRNLP